MNIFESIVSKIFTPSHAQGQASAPLATPAPAAPPQAPSAVGKAGLEQILSALAQKNSQKLNWQTSIVDLLKLLGLDSSLAARKNLAQELSYKGDMNDSERMNVWLSSEVMDKLAQNGGQVPAELKH